MKQVAKSPAAKLAVQAAATVAVLGLSVSTAHAFAGPPAAPVTPQRIGEPVHAAIGMLYAIRVPKALPTQIPAIPPLYEPFNTNDYLRDLDTMAKDALGLPTDKMGRRMLHMLGGFDVV